jgi:cytochrome P450
MNLADVDLTDLDFFLHSDPHEMWTVLRREAPVYWHERRPGRGFWAITRYDDALTVYHDPRTYSSERGIALQFNDAAAGDNAGFGMMMITTDPPRHQKIRKLISDRFTPRAVTAFAPHTSRIVGDIIDSVVERGECDFVVDVAAKLPTAVICEMLGIPREHWDMMFQLGNMSIGTEDPEYQQSRTAQETGSYAQAQFFSYFSKLIDERRKRPGNDLISALAAGVIDGNNFTDLEVLFNAFLLIIGGQETTRNAMSGGTLALIQFPAERERLKANPALMPTAIEEFLRWTSPVTHILRTARTDAELRGQKIRAGQKVVIWNASANRDEDVFAEPFKFDVARTPNDHLAFGHGEHFCIGAHLARLELRVMLEEVMRRMGDLELAGPVEKLRSNFVAGIKHMPVRFKPSRVVQSSAAAD